MIFVHEVHEVAGGKMEEFGEAVRTVWRPLIEEHRQARLLWFWELAHGTGASYQAVSLTAVRDWTRFAELLARGGRGAQRGGWMVEGLRYRDRWESKLLRCAPWSPRQ